MAGAVQAVAAQPRGCSVIGSQKFRRRDIVIDQKNPRFIFRDLIIQVRSGRKVVDHHILRLQRRKLLNLLRCVLRKTRINILCVDSGLISHLLQDILKRQRIIADSVTEGNGGQYL